MASRSSTFWKGAASTNQQLRFDKNINSDKFQLYHMYFDQERRSTREGASSLVYYNCRSIDCLGFGRKIGVIIAILFSPSISRWWVTVTGPLRVDTEQVYAPSSLPRRFSTLRLYPPPRLYLGSGLTIMAPAVTTSSPCFQTTTSFPRCSTVHGSVT